MNDRVDAKDIIFNAVYRGALKKGADERHAKGQAVRCIDEYKRRGIGKQGVQSFTNTYILEAKKLSKKAK